MNKTEINLRHLLEDAASQAPTIDDLGARIVFRARRERRRRMVALGGIAAGILLAVGIGTSSNGLLRGDRTADIPAAAANSRALPDTGMSDCQPPRSAADIAKRGFAFDGTVVKVGATSAPDATLARTALVTFTVNEWFKGGNRRTATVTMAAPLPAGVIRGEAGPSYQTGTRLLISGDGSQGINMRAGGCGYTRYFDPTSGSLWRSIAR